MSTNANKTCIFIIILFSQGGDAPEPPLSSRHCLRRFDVVLEAVMGQRHRLNMTILRQGTLLTFIIYYQTWDSIAYSLHYRLKSCCVRTVLHGRLAR